jgi:hypothetical protein
MPERSTRGRSADVVLAALALAALLLVPGCADPSRIPAGVGTTDGSGIPQGSESPTSIPTETDPAVGQITDEQLRIANSVADSFAMRATGTVSHALAAVGPADRMLQWFDPKERDTVMPSRPDGDVLVVAISGEFQVSHSRPAGAIAKPYTVMLSVVDLSTGYGIFNQFTSGGEEYITQRLSVVGSPVEIGLPEFTA